MGRVGETSESFSQRFRIARNAERCIARAILSVCPTHSGIVSRRMKIR